jgi:hypothetical protein
MAKWVCGALLAALIGTLFWEYIRVFQVEKDVVYHHTAGCSVIDHGAKIIDLTRYGDIVVGIADDWETIQTSGVDGVASGHLLAITGLKQATISSFQVAIQNFPAAIPFHPRGIYLYANSTLYVLNFAYGPHGTRIEVLNLTSSSPTHLNANYYGFILLPHYLHGKVGDLIVTSSMELYLSQYSSEADTGKGSLYTRFATAANDILGRENTYVHRCTYSLGKIAACSSLNSTASVSVTGITKDKFGGFFVAYSSVDYNWIGVYERKEDNGELLLRHRVPVRDRLEKIDWDEGWQRTYGGAVPYPYTASSALLPGGVVEMKLWDFRSGYIYRSLLMQDGSLLRGATCAARQGDFFLWASYRDTKVLVCPVTSPGN